MAVKVYVISEPEAIHYLIDSDLEGFKNLLEEDETLLIPSPEIFDTEAEALAFCSGIGHGTIDRTTPSRYPLRSTEPSDLPFIQALESV